MLLSEDVPIPKIFLLSGSISGLFYTLLHHLPNLRELWIDSRNALEVAAHATLGGFAGGIPAGLHSVIKLSVSYADAEVGTPHRCG